MKTCPNCRGTYPNDFTLCPKDGTSLLTVTEFSDGAIVKGKYKILSKLGEGGMGVVYKAHHLHFDELCALKVVSSRLAADSEFIQRFRSEALVMRKLDHPNAVRVHDFDETEDGRPFMAMEFVDGFNLADLITGGHPLEPGRAIGIVMQVCDALGAAHRLGIIHRDIKPSNILVIRREDGTEWAKVLDFGVAKMKERAGGPSGPALSTAAGFVVGTPAYMSPEQARGIPGSKLDGRSDLYSVGVVLYELLTGRTPFTADTPLDLLIAHIQLQPPDPREIRAELAPPLAEIVLRALEKDPAKRFASAEEMRRALDLALVSASRVAATVRSEERRVGKECRL